MKKKKTKAGDLIWCATITVCVMAMLPKVIDRISSYMYQKSSCEPADDPDEEWSPEITEKKKEEK